MAKNNVPISKITFPPESVEGRLWFDKLTTNGLREVIFHHVLSGCGVQPLQLNSNKSARFFSSARLSVVNAEQHKIMPKTEKRFMSRDLVKIKICRVHEFAQRISKAFLFLESTCQRRLFRLFFAHHQPHQNLTSNWPAALH